jgi:hypothetical protein
MKASFCNGVPLHVADPEKSALLITEETAFQSLSAKERQDIWGKRGKLAIVLTNCAGDTLKFDRTGLETITGRIDSPIEVQGMTSCLSYNSPLSSYKHKINRRLSVKPPTSPKPGLD